jgi:hypothetical protein
VGVEVFLSKFVRVAMRITYSRQRKAEAIAQSRMQNDSLAAHPLVKLVLENLKPLLEEAQGELLQRAEQGEVRCHSNATVFEYEFYDDDVFSKAGALIDCVDRLEQSEALIDAAGKAPWDGGGVDRHTWIEYHYSYYVVTVVSLVDIALILTNAVFRLGLRERDCRQGLIAENWWVARTPVKEALNNLANLIQPYREGRNLHVHRGRLQPIAEVMGSKLLDQLKLFSFLERAGKPVLPTAELQKGYNLEVPKIVDRLRHERTEIRTRIVAALDALFPVYKEKAEELHQRWRGVIEDKAEKRASRQGKPVLKQQQ